jgi:hypothetical protein
MEHDKVDRRGFLKGIAVALGGLTAIPVLAEPAEAARYRTRGYRQGWGLFGRRRYGYGRARTMRVAPRTTPYYYNRGYAPGSMPVVPAGTVPGTRVPFTPPMLGTNSAVPMPPAR